MTAFDTEGLTSNGHHSGFAFGADDHAAFDAAQVADDWLAGVPMDPAAQPADPVPAFPGWPFLPDSGAAVLIVGPTGGGRSSLVHACLYDSTAEGIAAVYLGHEVTEHEFQARTASLADKRDDPINDTLRQQLGQVRYLDLGETLNRAWLDSAGWVAGIVGRYRVVVIDPLSAVETALGLDFQSGGGDYLRFHDKLIQPLVVAGVIVVTLDNVGHAIDAKGRARGDSAKQDRADPRLRLHRDRQPTRSPNQSHQGPIRSRRHSAETTPGSSTATPSASPDAPQPTSQTRRPNGDQPARWKASAADSEEADNPLSKTQIRSLVIGKTKRIDEALGYLIVDKCADHTPLRIRLASSHIETPPLTPDTLTPP